MTCMIMTMMAVSCSKRLLNNFYSQSLQFFVISTEMTCKTGQMSIHVVSTFSNPRASRCWAEVDETWHVYYMGQGQNF